MFPLQLLGISTVANTLWALVLSYHTIRCFFLMQVLISFLMNSWSGPSVVHRTFLYEYSFIHCRANSSCLVSLDSWLHLVNLWIKQQGLPGFSLSMPQPRNSLKQLDGGFMELMFLSDVQSFVFCFFVFFCFVFSRAAIAAYEASQARSLIRAIVAGLQSHSNARSKPHLRPIPPLTATLDP